MKPTLIIGNGPSVDKLDPAHLNRFYSYGCNHIHKKFEAWGRATDNVVITDWYRLQEIRKSYSDYKGCLYIGDQRRIAPNYNEIRRLVGRDFVPLAQLPKRSLPNWAVLRRLKISKYLATTVFDKWRMSFDIEKGLNFGQSVVISAIQVAAINGAKKILLWGVDSRYGTAKDYFGSMVNSINYVNDSFISNPRLNMEPYLVIAQIYLEEMGVELVDCTPNGALKFISKGDLSDY